jgi:hypothetical protein
LEIPAGDLGARRPASGVATVVKWFKPFRDRLNFLILGLLTSLSASWFRDFVFEKVAIPA